MFVFTLLLSGLLLTAAGPDKKKKEKPPKHQTVNIYYATCTDGVRLAKYKTYDPSTLGAFFRKCAVNGLKPGGVEVHKVTKHHPPTKPKK